MSLERLDRGHLQVRPEGGKDRIPVLRPEKLRCQTPEGLGVSSEPTLSQGCRDSEGIV